MGILEKFANRILLNFGRELEKIEKHTMSL